jgi:cell division protein FtsL
MHRSTNIKLQKFNCALLLLLLVVVVTTTTTTTTTTTYAKVQFSVQKQMLKLESRYISSEWLRNWCREIDQLPLENFKILSILL